MKIKHRKNKPICFFITVSLSTLLLFLFSCRSEKKPKAVEIYTEDGIEVVLNKLEPASLSEEPKNPELEHELVISTEDEETAALGLTDIGTLGGGSFDVDSEGNIYIVCPKNSEHKIFTFD